MKIKARQLRDFSDKELTTLLSETQEKLRVFRFKDSVGQLKQNHNLSDLKKLIARIKTLLKERQ